MRKNINTSFTRSKKGGVLIETKAMTTTTKGLTPQLSAIICGVLTFIGICITKGPDAYVKIKKLMKGSDSDADEGQRVLRPSKVYGQHKTEGTDNMSLFLVENVKRGGISFVGGPSGSCKSVLVVQILTAIALGFRSVFDVIASASVSAFRGMKTFLYDGEMQVEDWVERYCTNGNNPPIEVIHKKHCRFTTIDDFLWDVRARVMQYGKDCVVAHDNITRMFTNITDQLVKELYDGLETIQDEMKGKGATVSFIIVCHTNDEVPTNRGIFERCFRGSGNLVNFADCAIGINKARGGKKFKYIKELKERHSGTDLVMKVCWSDKPYWHLEPVGEMTEGEALEEKVKYIKEGFVDATSSSQEPTNEKHPTANEQEIILTMRANNAPVDSICKALGVKSNKTLYNWEEKMRQERSQEE